MGLQQRLVGGSELGYDSKPSSSDTYGGSVNYPPWTAMDGVFIDMEAARMKELLLSSPSQDIEGVFQEVVPQQPPQRP